MLYHYSGGAMGGLFTFGGLGSVFWGAMRIASYVLTALALYTIAKRRGISKAWLSWIPVVNIWVLGSISDQYRDTMKGEVKNKRRILLILNVVLTVAVILYGILAASSLADVLYSASSGAGAGSLVALMLSHLLSGILMVLPLLAAWIAKLVITFMALYDLYTSCDPANNVLYLVLSIVPGISRFTKPLFLFLVRNRDDGISTRRYRRTI